jgi:outer membrane receptor protein involved in Fe transport
MDRKNLFLDTEDFDVIRTGQVFAEPFIDGDWWNDTGEPYINIVHYDSTLEEYVYNNVHDDDEWWFDLPSSVIGQFNRTFVATTNGVYDGPNLAFDEYELWTLPAGQQYGMDPRYPVLYTWEDVRIGIRNQGSEWVHMPYTIVGVDTVPGYLVYNDAPCPFDNMPPLPDGSPQKISTWRNVTLHDRANPVYNIPNFSWEPGKESFSDYNNNGREDPLADGFLNPGRWDKDATYIVRESEELSSKFNLTSQVNKYHELKTGFEVKYRQLEMNSVSRPDLPYTNTDVPLPAGSPFPDRGDIRDFYAHKPWEGALYFQDKMEFEGMIVRAGVRSDFVIQSNDLLEQSQEAVDETQPGALLAKRGRFVIAPRLGISHPISTKSKLYFNYGHYYQTPSFSYFYQSTTVNPSANPTIGNPNLEYEKTVSYELGVNTEFAEDWVLDVSGYYRDVYNAIGTVAQRFGPLTLNRYFNLGYARARGFEFSVEKKFSEMWALKMNYDFSYAYGKESAAAEGLRQRAANLPENRDEHPLNWDQTHTVTAFLTLMLSERDKQELFGIKIPNNWLATVEYSYGSGYPYTPSTFVENRNASLILANSARMPMTTTTDLKFDKFWKLTKKLKLTTGFEIYNLFNKKNVRGLYAETGNPYDSTHPDNTTQGQADILAENSGTDFDHNPRNIGSPRQIMLHLKIGF